MPFGSTRNLPVVVVTYLAAWHQSQDLMTYTNQTTVWCSDRLTQSCRPLWLQKTLGLVMGRVDKRPAFLVTSDALKNRVNLVWWTGKAWHRVWSRLVTTTEQVRIHSVGRFVAGTTPGTTFVLVSGPKPQCCAVPSPSSMPYWVIEPKKARLGQSIWPLSGLLKRMRGRPSP